MTDNSSLIARQSPAALYLFLDAMRCWGVARRAGQPTLVRLINLLQGRPIAPIVHQCSDAVACAFCSAVRSMQILMDMELGRTEQKRAA